VQTSLAILKIHVSIRYIAAHTTKTLLKRLSHHVFNIAKWVVNVENMCVLYLFISIKNNNNELPIWCVTLAINIEKEKPKSTKCTTDFPVDVGRVCWLLPWIFIFCNIWQGFWCWFALLLLMVFSVFVFLVLQFCCQLFMVFKLICGYKRLPACFYSWPKHKLRHHALLLLTRKVGAYWIGSIGEHEHTIYMRGHS